MAFLTDSDMLMYTEKSVVNRTVVRITAKMTARFFFLFARTIRSAKKRTVFLFATLRIQITALHDMAVFNPDQAVSRLRDFLIMCDHDDRLL